MKSHVKENIAKSILSNMISTKDLPNGEKEIVFSQFGWDMVKEFIGDVEATDWRIDQNGIYWANCKLNNVVQRCSGRTLKECIANISTFFDWVKRNGNNC